MTETAALQASALRKREWLRKCTYGFIVIGAVLFGVAFVILADQVVREIFRFPPATVGTATAIACVLPAFIAFLLASLTWAGYSENAESWKHVGYQIAAFLILALSLRAFGLHHAVTLNGSGVDAEKSIAEMAAIMILFVLAELAAFVGHDVIEAKWTLGQITKEATAAAKMAEKASKNFSESMDRVRETTDAIDRLRLATVVATLHRDVLNEAVTLVQAWGRRAPVEIAEDDLSAACWRVLLRNYLEEEVLDFAPVRKVGGGRRNGLDEGVPDSVTPTGHFEIDDLSFIATNIGFYAKLLRDLSAFLHASKRTDQRLCIASITPVLPAHWWNFPMPDGTWRSYHVIDEYREELTRAAGESAQIDRVILVHKDAVPRESVDIFEKIDGVIWRAELYDAMMNGWEIGVDATRRATRTLNCGPGFDKKNGPFGQAVGASMPLPIARAADRAVGTLYPMTTEKVLMESASDLVGHSWEMIPLARAYASLYGRYGRHWRLALDGDGRAELAGRYDFLFIGVGAGNDESGGLWHAEHMQWVYCLMSSMSPGSETMFLTVLSGASMRDQFNACREFLDRKLNWDEGAAEMKFPTDSKRVPSHPPQQPTAGS